MKRFFTSIFSLCLLVNFTWAQCTISVTPSAPQICFGSCVTLHASGADTYLWMPGGLTDSVVSLCPTTTTTYTVTGTDALSNTCSASVTVHVNPEIVLNPLATPNPICRGDNAVLNIAPQVNTTYIWNPGSFTGPSINVHPVVTTTYTVTAVNSLTGCTASDTITLVVNQKPFIIASATQTTTCFNQNTVLSANCTVNCTGVTYSWMPGAFGGTSITVHPTASTCYTVTATNANGCTATSTVCINVNPKPVLTPTATPATICLGGSSNLSASTSVPGTTFVWNPSGMPGTPVTVTPTVTTTYTVLGTSPAGCTGSAMVTVTVNPVDNPAFNYSPSVLCLFSPNVAANITGGSTGIFTSSPPLSFLNNTTGLIDLSASTAGSYHVTFNTNGPNACHASSTATIIITSAPSASFSYAGPYCSNGVDPFPTFGPGASGGTFSSVPPGLVFISTATGQVDLSASTAGTYTVTNDIAAAGGCFATQSTNTITINAAVTPTFNPIGPLCQYDVPPVLPLSSTNVPPISGTWNAALSTFTAGTTSYTFTPSAGQCVTAATMAITVTPIITPTFTPMGPYCLGSNIPALPTTSANGITGIWFPALCNTCVGNTYYTFTPAVGQCASTSGITITITPIITTTFTPMGPYCLGSNIPPLPTTSTNGVTGNWNAAVCNACVGNTSYTFTPTAGQCVTAATMSITIYPAPAISASASPTNICPGDTATLIASNATTYNWMPGNLSGATVDVTPTTSTTYTVNETNSGYNCSASVYVSVGANSTVTVPADITACINSLISQTNFTSNPPGSTFTWTNSNTDIGLAASGSGNIPAFNAANPTASPITAIITVTPSITGCTATPSSYTITVNPVQNVTASATPNPSCANGNVTLTSSNATSYNWTPGNLAGSPVVVQPLVTTTYVVTGYNSGYTCSNTINVLVHPKPVLTPTATPASICIGASSILTVTSNIPGTTFLWNPGGLSGIPVSVTPISTSTYTVTGTTPAGCTASNTITVTVSQALSPTINCGVSTTSSVSFTWAAVAGATGYTVSYQINALQNVIIGPIGNILTFPVSGLSGGDEVTITVTPTGGAGTCFASSTATCIALIQHPYIQDVSGSTHCHLPYLAILDIYDDFILPNDTIDYHLDFGDGTDTLFSMIYQNDPTPMASVTHIYNTVGSYSPSAILQHTNGLADTIYAPNLIVTSGSCGDISGKCFVDFNTNCVADSGEMLLSNKLIKLFDQSHSLLQAQFTDAHGLYTFNVPNGIYTVEIDSSIYANYTLYCPSGSSYSIPGIPAIDKNFGLNFTPGFDLFGQLGATGFRPNKVSYLFLTIGNYNSILTNAYVQLVMDPLTTYSISNLTSSTINGDTLTWMVNNLSASGTGHQYFTVGVYTSPLAVINDSLSFSLTVSPITGDLNPLNNVVNKKFRITNSYDPNEKEVSPAGDITANTDLTYTLHFQNTGNAEAYNIYLLDTLDDHLDLNNLMLLGSSHAYNAEILQANSKNILKFLFADIMLPDSGSNQMLSHGYVSYQISPLANTPEGTYIYNTADIYFDYNTAIITNTVQNVIPLLISVEETVNESTTADRIHPNPADQQATITFYLPEKGETSIEVFDITGKRNMTLLQQELEPGMHQLTFTVKDLNPGVYFIRIKGSSHLSVIKLVKIAR